MTWLVGREAALWWGALAAVTSILLFPLFLCDVPPLGDYPNHLARAFVLASLPGDPVLARMYMPHWSVIPNLGLDLTLPPLIRVLPVYVAGRVLIGASVILPFLGVVACQRALAGSASGRWWSLGAGLAAYDNCLMEGFLNFSLSIGLALLLAAVWFRWRDDRPCLAILLAVAGAPVLFFCHLMGLVFFAILAGCHELSRLRGWHDAVRRAFVLLLIFALPAVLYAVSALRSMGGGAEWLSPIEKLRQAADTFANYNLWLDRLTATVSFGIPALAVATGRGRFQPPVAFACVALLVLYLAAPYSWKGTFLLDTRFAVMLGLLMFAGFQPSVWPVRLSAVAGLAIATLFLARMAVLATGWATHNAALADIRAAIAPIQPGQTVYVAEAGLSEASSYWAADPRWLRLSDGTFLSGHLGALILIERRAYWPFEFDVPSQQPIVTLPPYAGLAEAVEGLPDRAQTLDADLHGFDFVLILDADAVAPLPSPRFERIAGSGFAVLYRIQNSIKPS